VSPSVIATTTTLQNVVLAYFGASLPTLHNTLYCFIKYASFKCFPRTKAARRSQLIHSPHRLLTRTWSSCMLSNFPLKFVHLWREASLPSRNCAILSDSLLGSRIMQSCQPTIPIGFAQIFWVVGCSAQDLCKSRKKSAAVPRNYINLLGIQPSSQLEMCIFLKQSSILFMCSWVDRFPLGLSKTNLHAWTTSPKATCKGILLFQGSMFSSWRLHTRRNSETSHQVSPPLDSRHAHHSLNVIKTHQPDIIDLIPRIKLATLTSHITSRSSRHIQLNYFRVISLPIPCTAFLSLFVFSLVWVLFTWFIWTLAIIYIYTSLS